MIYIFHLYAVHSDYLKVVMRNENYWWHFYRTNIQHQSLLYISLYFYQKIATLILWWNWFKNVLYWNTTTTKNAKYTTTVLTEFRSLLRSWFINELCWNLSRLWIINFHKQYCIVQQKLWWYVIHAGNVSWRYVWVALYLPC